MTAICATAGRIYAMLLRYVYLMRSSWPRVLEMVYWPTMQMILWAFTNQFLAEHSEWVAQAAGIFIGAILLWDVLFRSQLGVSVVFFEEMYSRNLGHLFVSPLRPWELVAALLSISLLRTLIGVGTAALLALLLYHYSIFALGLALVAFFFCLAVMGWAIGLMVVAMVLRYGLGAESLAWAIIFAIMPLCGVFYPIEVLPHWLQPVALALPASHVFEGLRAIVVEGVFRTDLLWRAVALDGAYLIIGVTVFLLAFRAARRRNLLLHMGE
ncbi:MAG: ABC transporter permease [Gammaproteobacteria bacterium]|jgi:ABC-2 type transport system permease protein|nr:ABC transporter permease [Gammaproteobacteria bacterium]